VIVNSGAQTIEFADGSAGAPSITNSGDTNTGMFFPAADTIAFAEGGTEAMRLDSSGNVGIGTASPTDSLGYGRALDIQSTAGAALYLRDSDATSEYTWLSYEGGATKATTIGNTAAGPMIFATNGSNRMRIDSSGNVGINVASPAATLDVFGRGKIETNTDVNPVLRVGATNGGSATIGCYSGYFSGNPNNTTASFFQGFSSTSTNRISIWSNGNIQNSNNSYGSLSDEKLKENIVDATPKLSDLMQVRIRNYNLKYDPEHKQIGVIAQELEPLFPGMIDETSDIDMEGNDLGTTTKSVKYSVFVPMLIKAIQEQQTIINDIKAELDNVKTELATLKGAPQ
jgi:hypothetical protein